MIKRRLGLNAPALYRRSRRGLQTAGGWAKMQQNAISLGLVAPVVAARRRVAASAAASSRAPHHQKSTFLGRRPSNESNAAHPRGHSALRAVADAAPPARAPRRGRGGRGGRGGGSGESGGSPGNEASARIQGELTGARDPREILAIVDADGDAFDAIHTATAIHRIATHTKGDATRESITGSPSFRALMDLVRANLSRMNSQGLANVAWACARLEHEPGAQLLDDIVAGLDRELKGKSASQGGRRTREVKPQAVSNMVWALGTLRHRPGDDVLNAIFAAVSPKLRDYRAQELTNVVLGAAHMEYTPDDVFIASVFDAVRENVRSFEGQETSNLLWAIARIGAKAPEDIVAALLEQSAAQNLGGMASAMNLSQCLWACAKMGTPPPEVYLKAVDAEMPRCAPRLTTESVDCILWALATIGSPLGPDAMDALTNSAARLADCMDAEMLVKTHWALARLRHRPAPGDMQQIVGAARRLADELPADDRLTVMHAWGVLRTNPGDDVIRVYTAEFRGDGEDTGTEGGGTPEAELDGDQCAKLLCAYGRCRHQPPGAHAKALAARLVEEASEGSLHPSAAVLGLWGASLLDMRMSTKQLDVLARDAIAQDKKLAPRSLAKIVWALAALGYDPTPIDLAALKERSSAAMPRLMAKDQEALREAMARLGDVQINAPAS